MVKSEIAVKKYTTAPIGRDMPHLNKFINGEYQPKNLLFVAAGKRKYKESRDDTYFRIYVDKNGVTLVHTCWWYNCHDFEFAGRMDDIKIAKRKIEKNLEIKLEEVINK